MKVAIIGSSTFPVIPTGPWLVEFVKAFPEGTVIYTRGSKGFDVFIGEVARLMGYRVEILKGNGGADNYIRDVKLVEEVDAVHAFFAEEQLGQGGTQHVVEKALDGGVAVYSYLFDGRDVRLVGTPDDSRDTPDPDELPPGSEEAVGEGAVEYAGSWASGAREG